MTDGPSHIYDPRGLPLEEAAHYWGLKPASFLKAVDEDLAPQPIQVGRRKIWDKKALDRALDRLSGLGDGSRGGFGDVGQNALRRR